MNGIHIENLLFSYNKNVPLIYCKKLEFSFGKVYALVGKNGSGKTTFLKLLLGLLKPSAGTLTGLEKQKIGFVPDYNGLYESLTILENIQFRLSLYREKYSDKKAFVDELLERYGLKDDANKLVKQLSLGMRKKTALICALAITPSLLILDEPTTGLDEKSQTELAQMLNQFISPNTMVICTSHDADFLESLGSEIITFPLEG